MLFTNYSYSRLYMIVLLSACYLLDHVSTVFVVQIEFGVYLRTRTYILSILTKFRVTWGK
jgi:hypothetical protein